MSKPAAKPNVPASLDTGDHVYANHPKIGAMVLKVLASGKDGFTGEDGAGGRHKVPHDAYLGHKVRAIHTYKVLDKGADGALLEDETGKRKFVAGDLPQEVAPPQEQTSHAHQDDPLLDGLKTLSKAFLPWPDGMVLLLKAQPVAASTGRPGLSQRVITDRLGRRANRWVRTAKDVPKVREKKAPEDKDRNKKPPAGDLEDKPLHKHGDMVSFRHGQVEGRGKIVASGQDGVTVQTEDGREHMVRHDALLPPKPGEDRTPPEPAAPPEDSELNPDPPAPDVPVKAQKTRGRKPKAGS